jgi:erythromycin esterase
VGDIDTATAIQGFWCWNTEEVKAIIKWMKEHNESHPEKKLKFVGFDIQRNDAALYQLSNLYARVEPDNKPNIDSLFIRIYKAEKGGDLFSGDSSVVQLKGPFEKIFFDYISKKGKYLLTIPNEEYEENFLNHLVILNYLDEYCTFKNESLHDRDFYMAYNVMYWLNSFQKETKMVLWAHNYHIAKASGGYSTPTMGYYLGKELQDQYYCIGFDFMKGKFQAINMDIIDSKGPVEHEITDSPKGYLSWYFNQAGFHNAFIDLTLTNQNDVISKWINEKELVIHSMGSGFSAKWLPSFTEMPTKLFKSYDGMIFIKETNRAVPNKRIEINRYKL